MCSELTFQPHWVTSTLGLASSSVQLVTVWSLSSLTSIETRAWGFIHSIFVTRPLSITGLSASYSAAKP
jgi:hypothetical protein